MRKLLITFSACSFAAMALATAASARPPEWFHFTESGTEVLVHCDGFDGILDTTNTVDGTGHHKHRRRHRLLQQERQADQVHRSRSHLRDAHELGTRFSRTVPP
jgi:hypothetical protein